MKIILQIIVIVNMKNATAYYYSDKQAPVQVNEVVIVTRQFVTKTPGDLVEP